MTTTAPAALDLQRAAREHLWLHFTRMGGYRDAEVPIIVRGDGCYLEDSNGKRYLDALAGLFSVNIGYGYGEEMGEAAAACSRANRCSARINGVRAIAPPRGWPRSWREHSPFSEPFQVGKVVVCAEYVVED